MENKKDFSKLGLIMFLGTLIIYSVQLLASLIFGKIPAVAENSNLSLMASMLPTYLIAYPIIFWMFHKMPVTLTGEKKKMRPLHIFVAFLIGYAATYICNIVGNILTLIIGAIKQSPVNNVMMDLIMDIHPLVLFFIVSVCAPVMEELLFRKAIIDRIAKYGEGVAIVVSGIMFGLFHGNLNQFSYAFVLGIFFGFIYIKTRNIIYSIILHMITNFLGSVVGTLVIKVSGYMEITQAASTMGQAELIPLVMDNLGGLMIFLVYFLCLMGFVIAGIVLFFVNIKKFRLSAGEVTIPKKQRFKTTFCNKGMLLFCAFWIVRILRQLFA